MSKKKKFQKAPTPIAKLPEELKEETESFSFDTLERYLLARQVPICDIKRLFVDRNPEDRFMWDEWFTVQGTPHNSKVRYLNYLIWGRKSIRRPIAKLILSEGKYTIVLIHE